MEKQPKVALIMGSDSDFPALKGCISFLKEYGIEVDVQTNESITIDIRLKE